MKTVFRHSNIFFIKCCNTAKLWYEILELQCTS